MAFLINNIITKLANGGARPTLFEVSITNMRGTNSTTSGDLLRFMCKGVQIPSVDMGIATVNYYGRPIKFPGNRPAVTDLTTTIINDEGYAIRNTLENWMHNLNGHENNQRNENYHNRTNYVGQMTIKTFSKTGAADQQWKLINCFPMSVEMVALSWDPTDAIMEYNVIWKYDYWTHVDTYDNNNQPISA